MADPDRLWTRYWNICNRRGNGYATPILWHLALRGHVEAMLELSTTFEDRGRRSDPFSQEGLAYRAFRKGQPLGAQHLAMNAFNGRDLAGYRHWLARAARAGNQEARRELRRFEVRLPHCNAGKIGRRRPERSYDFE